MSLQKLHPDAHKKGGAAMIRSFLILMMILASLMPVTARSQAPDTTWFKTYNFGYNNEGWSVRETSDGGLILVGSGMPNNFDNWEINLIKTDANGILDWIFNYGELFDHEGCCVRQTTDGNYIIAGWARLASTAGKSILLIKAGENGLPIWNRTYSDYDDQEIRSIEFTSDGGYILAGWAKIHVTSNDSSYEDMLIIKTNSLGNAIWSRHYGGINSQKAWSIKNTFDGGFIVAGWTDIFPLGSQIYLIKLNQDGDTLWTRTYGYLCNDGATSVLELPNHNIVIGGSITDGRCNSHAMLIFLNQNGDSLNTVLLPYTLINSMSITNDNDLIICGPYSDNSSSAYIAKVNLNGEMIWANTFEDYPNAFSARSVIQTSDGGYVFTGTTLSYPENIILAKLASEQTGIYDGNNSTLPDKIGLSQNYPNPFNSSTLFTYRLVEKGQVNLAVYNLLGQRVAALIDGIQDAGVHQVFWNSGDNSSGVYFARLAAGRNSQNIKLILMK
jgi:hypothetical protein